MEEVMGGTIEVGSGQRKGNWTVDDWAVFGRFAAQMGLDRDNALMFLARCTKKKPSKMARWIFKARYNQALGIEPPLWGT